MRAILVVSLLGAGCFDFDPEADRFTCEKDDDCAEGYVCSGHAIVQRSAVAYCVAKADAMAGLHVYFGRALCSGEDVGPERLIQYEVFFGTSTSTATPVQLPAEAAATCNEASDNLPCCSGVAETNGNGRLMCVAPREGVVMMGAEVRFTKSGNPFHRLPLMSAEVASDGPPLAEITYEVLSTNSGCSPLPVDCTTCP